VVPLPVYTVALLLSFLSDALGKLAAWIAGDEGRDPPWKVVVSFGRESFIHLRCASVAHTEKAADYSSAAHAGLKKRSVLKTRRCSHTRTPRSEIGVRETTGS